MELPRLQPLYETYKDRGFEVIAIERMRDTERAEKFIAKHGLTYTLVENGEGEDEVVRDVFGIRSFPTSMIVDRDGRVMFYHLGFEEGDEEKMAEEIERLL